VLGTVLSLLLHQTAPRKIGAVSPAVATR